MLLELTMGNFTSFSRNFEMPMNRGFEINFTFYAKFHFHGGGAYCISAIDIPELVLRINPGGGVT